MAPPKSPPADFASLLEAYEAQPPATDLLLCDVAAELGRFTKHLQRYDPVRVISAAAALASLCENHTLVFRLDTLILLAALHCKGDEVPTIATLDHWLNSLVPQTAVGRLEDPAEDFAVGLVRTQGGNRLVLNGFLSGPDAYLQDVIDALQEGPESLAPLRSAIDTVLDVSDALVRRRGYDRFTAGPEAPGKVTFPATKEALWDLARAQLFTEESQPEASSFAEAVQPFTFTLQDLREVAPRLGMGHTRSRLFLKLEKGYLLAFPTSVCDALIEFVLHQLDANNMLRGFNNQLNRTQATRLFEQAGSHFGQDSFVMDEAPLKRLARPAGISEAIMGFDHNRYFHLVLVHDDMREARREGLSLHREPSPALADHLGEVSSILAARPDYVSGFTLVVMLGVGRPYGIAMPSSLPPGWFQQVWSLYDFERLQWIERHWESMLWKLSKQRDTLAKRNISIISPDDATLYARWMNGDYKLIPGPATEPGRFLLAVSCGEMFAFRQKVRLRLDMHAAYRPDAYRWVNICRVNPLSEFKAEREGSRYGSPDMAAQGLLAGAVLTAERVWWIDCNALTHPDADRHYLYKVWETANIWLARVSAAAEQHLQWPAGQNVVVTLDLSAIAEIKDWSLLAMEGVPPVAEFATERDRYGFTIKVPLAFVAMGRQAENHAEMLLAKALVAGAAACSDKVPSSSEIEGALVPLQISPDERHMHTLVASDHRDYLRQFGSTKYRLLGDADTRFAEAEIAYEAGLAGPLLIENRQEGNDCLKRIVDAFWERCKRHLQGLDRLSLVLRCLSNNEAVLAEQDIWSRTRRAVAALHKDREETLAASLDARRKMDHTQISQRILIEMAICTCPEAGGREVNQEDIDYLGAQVLQLGATAQQADAMRAEAIPAWVRIGLAGDVRLASDFSELMEPYLSSQFEVTHRADIANYERHLEEPKRGTKTEAEAFGAAFLSAFIDEYGITPIRLLDAATVLAEDAHQQRTEVVVRSVASVRELLQQAGYSEAEIVGLLQHFMLPIRPDWTAVEPPFRNKDWWPWRYRRHLSVMNRPIIALSASEVAYAPGFCEDAFRHVVSEAYAGSVDTEYFSSRAMRRYIGSANAARGLAFNKAVAERFRSAGWKAWTETEMSRLLCPRDQAAGDIDVIAEKDGMVLLCECKDLSFARTITEVVEQLGRFKGKHNDELWKHLRRVSWCQQNPLQLRHVIGFKPVEVRSLLVCSKIVPMQFAENFPEKVASVDDLEEVVKEASAALPTEDTPQSAEADAFAGGSV